MAIGDTAKLVASLELQDKFSGTANKFNSTIAGMERQTSTLGRLGGQINSRLKNTAVNLTRIGVVGGGLLAAGIQQGLQALGRLEEVQVATNTVIASTQGIAGQTAESIRNLAEKYESLNATMDDKVIQSGENMLLTFTNIRKEAFEPALEAALNMNQVMGGGEEGLQNTIIQLGKALNDPVKGFTALKRVGVTLSAAQQQQIKDLVKQNDLYGAQQVILEELSTEFGGQFAKAGETATAKFAKLKDAIEESEMSLAQAFLPVLSKVADKLNTFLSDEKVQAQIKEFGEGLAGGLDQVIEFAGKLPWGAIGDAFKLAGTGAKAVLDAFTALPPWIQTAVLTGWGLNKLTGGALTGIAGTLAKAVFGGGVRGSTPLTPVYVKDVGLPGVGGGAPGVGGAPAAGAGLGGFLAPGLGAAGVVIGGAAFLAGGVPIIFRGPEGSGAKPMDTRAGTLDATQVGMLQGIMPGFITGVEKAGGKVVKAVNAVNGTGTATRSSIDKLRSETRALRDPITALRSGLTTTAARTNAHLAAIERVDSATAASTAAFARKPLTANVDVTSNVAVTANISVSASQIQRNIRIAQSASQTSFVGHGGDSRF